MLKKYLVFNLLYFLLLVLVAVVGFISNRSLVFGAMSLACVMLMVFLYTITRLQGKFHRRTFIGLFAACAGALFNVLIPGHHSLILYTTIAGLISAGSFTRAFYLDFRSAPELDKSGAKIAITVCFVVFTAFYFYLRPHLPLMKLPVLICLFLNALLVMMAAFRNQRVNQSSFKLVLSGVILLVAANACIAQVFFIKALQPMGIIIPVLYLGAYYLITLGAAERKLIHTETPV